MKISKKAYYENYDIAMEILLQVKNREMCFIPFDPETRKAQRPVRWLLANYINMMKKHFEQFNFYDKPMNLYHSLATYKNFPMFSYMLNIKAQQQQLWMDKFHEYLEKYDFFIETDSSEDFNLALSETKEIKDLFDKFSLRYYCKFSGSKGFHVIISYEDFAHLNLPIFSKEYLKNVKDWSIFLRTFPFDIKKMHSFCDYPLLFKGMVLRIKGLLASDTIDASVTDIKRVCKVGYSLDEKSGLVAYPLTDEQFLHFNKEDYSPEKVIRMNNYKRRLCWRNDNLTIEQRQENINKLLKYIGILSY